jgi:hypothetical protein
LFAAATQTFFAEDLSRLAGKIAEKPRRPMPPAASRDLSAPLTAVNVEKKPPAEFVNWEFSVIRIGANETVSLQQY